MSLSPKLYLKNRNILRGRQVTRSWRIRILGIVLLFSLLFVGIVALVHAETYTFILKWGSLGTGNGEFNSPYDVAVDSEGNVYVADTYNDRIQKFTSEGDFLGTWGSSGTDNGQFSTPKGVDVDSEGNIYIADTSNHRIQKFRVEPPYMYTSVSAGNSKGVFLPNEIIYASVSAAVIVAIAIATLLIRRKRP